MLTKNCTKCNIEKLESEFYRGKGNICKACTSNYKKEIYETSKLRNINDIIIPDKKVCAYCNIEKHGSEFYIYLLKKDGLRHICKKCHNRAIDARRKTNPKIRMLKNMSKRYKRICKDSGTRKSDTTIQSLGCSGKFFAKYIEKQFKPGMNWDNYGEWHIDHIRPWASIDINNKEEIALCCHYTNLQPLWAHENITKAGKWQNSM